MIRRFVGLFATAVALGCGGSAPVTSPSPAVPGTFTLSGKVTSTTGTVIGGATIQITDGPNANRSTSTDGFGTFSLNGLTESGFTVSISAPYYSSVSRGVTLTSNQTLSVQLSPQFSDMRGVWSGTATVSGTGLSESCNSSWLILLQTGGDFSGSFQSWGGTNCAETASFSGSISSSNTITDYQLTTITVGIGNGTVCTDSNVTTTGFVRENVVTLRRQFTRTCTSPSPTTTFSASETISMTKQ